MFVLRAPAGQMCLCAHTLEERRSADRCQRKATLGMLMKCVVLGQTKGMDHPCHPIVCTIIVAFLLTSTFVPSENLNCHDMAAEGSQVRGAVWRRRAGVQQVLLFQNALRDILP